MLQWFNIGIYRCCRYCFNDMDITQLFFWRSQASPFKSSTRSGCLCFNGGWYFCGIPPSRAFSILDDPIIHWKWWGCHECNAPPAASRDTSGMVSTLPRPQRFPNGTVPGGGTFGYHPGPKVDILWAVSTCFNWFKLPYPTDSYWFLLIPTVQCQKWQDEFFCEAVTLRCRWCCLRIPSGQVETAASSQALGAANSHHSLISCAKFLGFSQPNWCCFSFAWSKLWSSEEKNAVDPVRCAVAQADIPVIHVENTRAAPLCFQCLWCLGNRSPIMVCACVRQATGWPEQFVCLV